MIQQNTPEWRQQRAGKITASRMCDVLAFGKRDGKPLKARTDYIGEIVASILTGQPAKDIKAKALDWGHDVEVAARAAYEAETGSIVELAEFVTHKDVPYMGCSPDGLISIDGGMQIKCPENPVNHIDALEGGMPEEHRPQIMTELFVTGREWWDFVSFDPRMPPALRLYRQRIVRDEKFIAEIAAASESLWAEVQRRLSYLTTWAAAA